MLKNYKVILASQSPRRQELFKGLDIPFTVQTLPELKESYPQNCKELKFLSISHTKKANAFRTLLTPDTLIITADTIVARWKSVRQTQRHYRSQANVACSIG